LTSLDWAPADDGGWQIMADLVCADCGAYQAADCDPTHDRARPIVLAVRLFNSVGWRKRESGETLCPECATKAT
jgi:hypothetical protein